MKIWDRLHTKRIFLDVPLPDKDAVLQFIAEAFANRGIVKDADVLYDGLKAREETMSTGIGGGIGIPHAMSNETGDAAVLLIRCTEPVEFESLDAAPVKIIVALVVPEGKPDLHLQILASLARLCQYPGFFKTVQEAKNPKALFEAIKRLEESISFH
jgi:mannitol/fructose-specific phosphotransferase system IIA component (Ntr-type)